MARVDVRALLLSHSRRSPSGCLVWFGATTTSPGGLRYPKVKLDGRTRGAHRVALELRLGRPIRRGLQALHSCDVTLCVEGTHLQEGTPKRNSRDMSRRGRCAASKLRPEQVKAIRVGYRNGHTARALGVIYRVSRSAVQKIVTGKSYAWIGA